jgi:hypothetical protein
MEVSSHLMLNKNEAKGINKKHTSTVPSRPTAASTIDRSSSPSRNATENLTDDLKRRLIIDTCGGIQEKTKILSLRQKQLELSDQFYPESMKSLYNNALNHNAKKVVVRAIQNTPDRILDAPDFRDDYCKQILNFY